jgi:probable phosphoglycerate mutase
MERLILVRHAHSASNERDVVSCSPPGEGLSELGVEQALALREALAAEPIDLGLATELRRSQETLELALTGRDVPTEVFPGLNEIHFGAFEGGPLASYREWAWTNEPDVLCPGGGESRVEAAVRFAGALGDLLSRAENAVLLVSHALPVRYVIDASDGRFPAQRIGHVPHATPFPLAREAVERAAETLRVWAEAPRFAGG